MAHDLRKKLARLGVTKGARHLNASEQTPSPKRPLIVPPLTENRPDIIDGADEGESRSLERWFPNGRLATNSHGTCFVIDHVYPHHYQHGRFSLETLVKQDHNRIEQIDPKASWQSVRLDQILFIDTETTGLRGAGTIAFMIGVAFFDQTTLTVRQFFLRDHGDESAALFFLAQLVEEKMGLVTFNGRSFDLPLLDGRFFMNRIDLARGELTNQPHFDLLHPARRLWREQYESCSLGSLENNVLGIKRTHQDVPGHLIPFIYNDYLHSGDLSRLQNVFYHNQLDMLSMVTLMAHILMIINQPHHAEHPLELLGLAKWYIQRKQFTEAERILYLGLSQSPHEQDRALLLKVLASLLKKLDRRLEARPFWDYLATQDRDIESCVELSKLHEWHEIELTSAYDWVQKAICIAQQDAPYDRPLHAQLEHRLNRLRHKLPQAK